MAWNVASGEPHSVGDLARELSTAMRGPAPEIVGGGRVGDLRHVVADPASAAKELGFRASVDFVTGIREFATAPMRAPSGGDR